MRPGIAEHASSSAAGALREIATASIPADFRRGTCAVMYLTPGFAYDSIHKWIMQLTGKY